MVHLSGLYAKLMKPLVYLHLWANGELVTARNMLYVRTYDLKETLLPLLLVRQSSCSVP